MSKVSKTIEKNNSFFEKSSLSISKLKLLVKFNKKDTKFFTVHGLGEHSYMEEAFTNKDIIKKYKPSNLKAEQIGYILTSSNKLTSSFVGDMGMENYKYNRQLVFTSKKLAEEYLHFCKTDRFMIKERVEFLESLDEMFSPIDDILQIQY
ncbi:MAG: hypothetical protein [Caudoviricetes sp.]|nr:MAG: hypothetical protein [Caudoviricetes sp.]